MKRLSSLALAQFFEDFHNMHATGMTISQIVYSLNETSTDEALKRILTDLEHKISEGDSITEAIIRIDAFPWIVPMTIQAGEQSGKLKESLQMLSSYFRRSNDVEGRVLNALIYPAIVFVFLIGVMLFVGLHVVPRLSSLLPSGATTQGATRIVLMLSASLQQYWALVILMPTVFVVCLFLLHRRDKEAFRAWVYQWPFVGKIVKESALANYLLNLSVLLKSGVPLLRAINNINALHSTPISKRFVRCQDYIFGGLSFWEALAKDNFFSSVVVFTLRRGEEMARLDEYCLNLSDYFTKRANTSIDGVVHIIQPVLLALAGLFLVVIAFAFLVPIYGSLSKIAGG